MLIVGGPTSIFVKHLSPDELFKDLEKLYLRLVDLGVECPYGEVHLADLVEYNEEMPP